jgi:adenylate kinase
VTGTPGTGKTVFSRRLANEIGARYISLADLVSKYHLYKGVDRRRRSKIVDELRARLMLETCLTDHALAVVDTHLPEGIIPEKATKQVFVLRCHPRILGKRLRARRWGATKIQENILAELLDTCLIASVMEYGLRRVVQLDTSHTTLKRSVSAAKQVLTRRSTVHKIKIDWIATLRKEGSLDRYLR